MAAYYEQDLNDNWYLHPGDPARTIPTNVPCSVFHDLMRAGLIEDPYYRDNELKALPLMERDYTYTKQFGVPQALLSRGRILLRFEGIDTLADLYLNCIRFGTVDNMHRTWEFDVKGYLQEGANELRVTLHSPTCYIRSQYSRDRVEGTSDAMRGFPHIRKAHYMLQPGSTAFISRRFTVKEKRRFISISDWRQFPAILLRRSVPASIPRFGSVLF